MIRLIAMLVLLATPLAAQVIVDNGAAGYSEPSGTWTGGTSATGKYGADYRFASTVGSAGPATATAEWRPNLSAGDYEVATWYPSGSNRANDAPAAVAHSSPAATTWGSFSETAASESRRVSATWVPWPRALSLRARGEGLFIFTQTEGGFP